MQTQHKYKHPANTSWDEQTPISQLQDYMIWRSFWARDRSLQMWFVIMNTLLYLVHMTEEA